MCDLSHVEYTKDGLKHMRLKFYIEGAEPGLKGTVHSESKEVGISLVIYEKPVEAGINSQFIFELNDAISLVISQNPETGKYEFRYIFVDIDTYPRRTIIVEDNR